MIAQERVEHGYGQQKKEKDRGGLPDDAANHRRDTAIDEL